MYEDQDGLALTEDTEGFLLSVTNAKQQTETVRLSPQQVLTLGQSTLAFRAQVLQRLQLENESIRTTVATVVRDLIAWPDSILENVLVTLSTQNAGEVTFGFSPALARKLLHLLPPEIEKVETAKQTKQ